MAREVELVSNNPIVTDSSSGHGQDRVNLDDEGEITLLMQKN